MTLINRIKSTNFLIETSVPQFSPTICVSAVHNLSSTKNSLFRVVLNCLSFNAQHIMNNFHELQALLASSEIFHIIAITETWLNASYGDASFDLPDYHVFWKDRQSVGGGVAFLIHKSLQLIPQPKLSVDSVETLWFDILSQKSYFRFGVAYLPNHSDLNCAQQLIENIKSACLQPKNCPFILVGDFNCPNIDWNNDTFSVDLVQNLFNEFVLENDISQFVLEL